MGKAASIQSAVGSRQLASDRELVHARAAAFRRLYGPPFNIIEIALATACVAVAAIYLTAAAILRRVTDARAGMRGSSPGAAHDPVASGAAFSSDFPIETPHAARVSPASGRGGALSFRPRPAIGPDGRLDAAAFCWAFAPDPDFSVQTGDRS